MDSFLVFCYRCAFLLVRRVIILFCGGFGVAGEVSVNKDLDEGGFDIRSEYAVVHLEPSLLSL